ncbi:MAG: SIS domain-containing protein [Fibrobacterota bacterium]
MRVKELFQRHPELKSQEKQILSACAAIEKAFRKGKKLLLCGNGGSAADCDHISGEFLKSFMKKRPLDKKFAAALKKKFGAEGRFMAQNLEKGYPAIPLVVFPAVLTAYANDRVPALCFAQLVNALGQPGDVLLGLSTSGNSTNVNYACMAAKAKGLTVLGLMGRDGGKMKKLCDTAIVIQGRDTPAVQELHLPVYHALCEEVEARLE